MQLDNFHAKGASGRKIRVGEVFVIHDKLSKRLMWETGVVKELLPSCDGLLRSAIVEFPNGKLLTRAIQCLYPVELREDQPEDVEIADGALNPEPVEATAPQFPNPPDPAPLPLLPIDPTDVEEDDHVANPAATDVGEVESQGKGSGWKRKTSLTADDEIRPDNQDSGPFTGIRSSGPPIGGPLLPA
jgi:hypothetical protein